MRFEARSYSMGAAVATRRFDATNYAAAIRHPVLRELPRAANDSRGKIAVIGIKLLR